MLEIPTRQELQTQANDDVQTEINGALGARLASRLAYALAALTYGLYLGLRFNSRQLFIDTASTPFALLWASIYGVTPRPATQASGPVQFTGVSGSVFVGGEVCASEDGTQYTVLVGGEVPGIGELILEVEAVDAGASGNLIEGQTIVLQSPPAGVDTNGLTVNGGIEDGFDVETSESVVARTLELIRAPRRGGSEEDYQIWSKEVPGISAAFARGSFAGAGTVLVIVAQEWDPGQPFDDPENTPVPSTTLIGDVEVYLEARKPAGLHLVAVQPPVLQELTPFVVLDPDTPDIRTAVLQSLGLALANVEPGGVAYYDDQVRAIDRAAGEEHHQLWIENPDNPGEYGPYNTPVGDNSLMIPGTPTWTEPP